MLIQGLSQRYRDSGSSFENPGPFGERSGWHTGDDVTDDCSSPSESSRPEQRPHGGDRRETARRGGAGMQFLPAAAATCAAAVCTTIPRHQGMGEPKSACWLLVNSLSVP